MSENTANIGFEKEIWDAACILRGNMDAAEYKQVVLGLIFLKYISDKFEARYNELMAFLDQWCHAATFSRIEPMKDLAKMLTAHRPLILNYFRAKKQFNSGIVEGLNRKINLTIRKSFGFRTLKIAKVCLYHQLGELPEPDFAHKFW